MPVIEVAKKAVWWGLMISAFGLAGCTQQVRLVPICNQQYTYPPATMGALYNEIEAYGNDTPTMVRMLGNFSDMRLENSICIKAQKAYFKKWGTEAPSLTTSMQSLDK